MERAEAENAEIDGDDDEEEEEEGMKFDVNAELLQNNGIGSAGDDDDDDEDDNEDDKKNEK